MTAYEIIMFLLVAFIAFNTLLISASLGNLVASWRSVLRGMSRRLSDEGETERID